MERDTLFKNVVATDYMFPLFGLDRGALLDAAFMNDAFGPLKMGMTFKTVFRGVGFGLGGLFLIIAIFLIYRYKKNVRTAQDSKDKSTVVGEDDKSTATARLLERV